MFQRPLEDTQPQTVTIEFEGTPISVPAGESVASALCIANVGATRTTPVSGSPRSAYCLMGVCFECLVIIDGIADQQACMITVREGMKVQCQKGASDISSGSIAANEAAS